MEQLKLAMDKLQQTLDHPQPVQVQVNPQQSNPGFDIYAMLLQAHTAAIQNATDIRNHLKECSDRDRRNETMFADTKTVIDTMSKKLETNKAELTVSIDKVSADVNASNKWIYMIVGGITLGGVLLEKVDLGRLFGH